MSPISATKSKPTITQPFRTTNVKGQVPFTGLGNSSAVPKFLARKMASKVEQGGKWWNLGTGADVSKAKLDQNILNKFALLKWTKFCPKV